MKHPKDPHSPKLGTSIGGGGGVPPEKKRFKRLGPPQSSLESPVQAMLQSVKVALAPPFSIKLSQS